MVLITSAVVPVAAFAAFNQERANLFPRQATTDLVSVYEQCTSQAVTCIPTVRSCASSLCARCTGLGATVIDSCCGESNAATCFSSVLAEDVSTTTDDAFTATSNDFTASTSNDFSVTGAGGATITEPPAACTSLAVVVTSCSRADANFDNEGSTEIASCLCYNSRTSFVGSQIDGYIDTCVSYLSTAEPSLYSSIEVLQGFCSAVGDVRSDSPASSSPSYSTRSVSTSRASAGSSAVSTGAVATATSNVGFKTDAQVWRNPMAGLVLAASIFLTLA